MQAAEKGEKPIGPRGRTCEKGKPAQKIPCRWYTRGGKGVGRGITRCSMPLCCSVCRGEARRGEVRLTLRGSVRSGFQVIPEGLIVRFSR